MKSEAMHDPTFAATPNYSTMAVLAQDAERAVSASCAVMTVAYLARIEAEQEHVREDIEILIPGEQAALYATHRTPDGCRLRTCVRGPHVSVIPASQPYVIDCQRQSDMIVIALDQTFYERKARQALGSQPPELVEQYAAVDPFMREVGNSLRREFRTQRIPSATYLESLAGVIAIHLAMNYGGGHTTMRLSPGLSPRKLNRVQAFITEHFAEAILVPELAATIHMSSYHFARMFKQATGQPPHLYITVQRMERAKELLRNSDLPLADVAASVGFQTQGHFTGVFHKHTGLTPRIFRLNCQATHFQGN